MKDEITIYESPVSDNVIATFDNIDDLEEYATENQISADCVAINGSILLGWDEVYEFCNRK